VVGLRTGQKQVGGKEEKRYARRGAACAHRQSRASIAGEEKASRKPPNKTKWPASSALWSLSLRDEGSGNEAGGNGKEAARTREAKRGVPEYRVGMRGVRVPVLES